MSHIVAYFVTRLASDRKVVNDFKSINKSAEGLYKCGHVQNVQVLTDSQFIYIKSKCLPEMRKDRVYLMKVALKSKEYDVVLAECGCPARKGPYGSCKHIAALTYALADFSRLCILPAFQTATDKLQQWNQPRSRHVNIIPVDKLGFHHRELQPSTVRSQGSGVVFDPRPPSLRNLHPMAIENLRCDLQQINKPCGLLNIIIPSLTKIEHDHGNYCTSQLENEEGGASTSAAVPSVSNQNTSLLTSSALVEKNMTQEDVLESLSLTSGERIALEKQTRKQSNSSQWHVECRRRITGSKCRRIIIQKRKTVPLLQFCLYPKPIIHLPKSILWGKENEANAHEAYVKCMHSNGHPGLIATEAGFIVHFDKCWLGASPDAWVTDPQSLGDDIGLAEFKCPYTKAFTTPEQACEDL